MEIEHNTTSQLDERLREGDQTEGELNLKTHCWPRVWSSAYSELCTLVENLDQHNKVSSSLSAQSRTTVPGVHSYRHDRTKPFIMTFEGNVGFNLRVFQNPGMARVPVDMQANADAVSAPSCDGGPVI